MIHPEDRKACESKIDDAIKRGGPFYIEFRVLSEDGKTVWLSSTGTVDQDASGRPIQTAGICQDITARKMTEQALRESLARERARTAELEALMDAVPAMIWISRDSQCKEMVGNRYGYEFLRMWEGANISKTAPETELAQQPYRNFKNGQEISENELPMQIAASTGVGTSNFEFDLVFKNGMTKNLLGNVIPLTDSNGNPSGAVAAFVDVTERKRIEDELRKSEQRFRISLASAPIAVFMMDEDLRYTWLFDPNHDFSQKQMVGKRDDEIFDPEGVVRLTEMKRLVIETGQAVQGEISLKVNDVGLDFVIALEPIFGGDGSARGLIGAAFDFTEQHRLEAVQRENEIKMTVQRHLLASREDERKNVARDIHDGPLQTLVAMLFDLHSFRDVGIDQAVKVDLTPLELNLKNAIQELRQVINELRPLNLTIYGLGKAIQGQAEEIHKRLPGLDIFMDLDEGANTLPEQVNMALYRICQEALHNVIKHSKANKVFIRILLQNQQASLVVQDNGIGFPIANDFSELVEDQHYGLAGMKERAEAVSGTMRVSSEPGRGIRIETLIPI